MKPGGRACIQTILPGVANWLSEYKAVGVKTAERPMEPVVKNY